MHVAVVLRLVPDTSEELEVDATGSDIDREWIGTKLNEFDDSALEEAVLLKERAGAKVTALCLAGDGADRQLQTAIARGVDQAVRVEHGAERYPDARSAALVLKKAVTELGADLVLTGVQTPEDVFGQLAPYLAGALDWPTLNAVGGVTASGSGISVMQEYSGGVSATFDVKLPAVLGIQTSSQPPRYVSGTKLRQAMGAPIQSLAANADGHADPRDGLSLTPPSHAGHATMIEGDADAVAAKVIDVLAGQGLLGAR